MKDRTVSRTSRAVNIKYFTRSIHNLWGLLLVEGIIIIVFGVVAIALPPIAGLVVTILLGWLLVMSGLIGLVTTLVGRHTPGFWFSLFSAIVTVVAAVPLLKVLHPPGLVQIKPATFLAPAIVTLVRYPGFTARNRHRFARDVVTSICRSSVTICSGVGLFFAMFKLLSKPISINSLGTKRAGQVRSYFFGGSDGFSP